jgi:hypothetical protein
MNDDAAELPELYRVIRVGLPEAPVPELADVEAWRAREKYPELRTRMPWFAVAEQEPDGRWRVLSVDDFEPQNCRDHLAHVCRLRAKDAEEAGDRDAVRAWETGYLRMESRKVDDLAVLDTRFRIIRGDFFFRVGPTGPEPPRPTDPDPAPIGAGRSAAHGAQGFLLDPTAATGISEALLKLDFMHSSYPQSAPPDVRADSMKAVYTHPGGVLLPAAFGIFEETATHWASQPLSYETPQAARDSLASGFAAMLPARVRVWHEGMREFPEELRRSLARRDGFLAPGTQELSDKQMRKLDAAVERLQRERLDEIRVLRRRYRIVRLERFVRLGPEGPEPPRPSDFDELEPIKGQADRDRAAGLYDDEEEEATRSGTVAESGSVDSES